LIQMHHGRSSYKLDDGDHQLFLIHQRPRPDIHSFSGSRRSHRYSL
jgi:hypothetical protein